MAKAKTPRKPVSFTKAVADIDRELENSSESPFAIVLSDMILKARKKAVQDGIPVEEADATELLMYFHPTGEELERMGLPKDFLDDKCSNHTALFMAEFTRFTRSGRATKKKRKAGRRKK